MSEMSHKKLFIVPATFDYNLVIFFNFNILSGEDCDAIIIAELTNRDQ